MAGAIVDRLEQAHIRRQDVARFQLEDVAGDQLAQRPEVGVRLLLDHQQPLVGDAGVLGGWVAHGPDQTLATG